jgi:hypothetical protein
VEISRNSSRGSGFRALVASKNSFQPSAARRELCVDTQAHANSPTAIAMIAAVTALL